MGRGRGRGRGCRRGRGPSPQPWADAVARGPPPSLHVYNNMSGARARLNIWKGGVVLPADNVAGAGVSGSELRGGVSIVLYTVSAV